MNIILGASGRVGSAIVTHLLDKQLPVKAVVHDEKKAAPLAAKGAATTVADVTDQQALLDAMTDGTTLFVLTPETGKTNNMLEDVRTVLAHYRHAVEGSEITKIVGLSSMGAQYEQGTGNLQMSYLLEHAFPEVAATKVFIRPAYYFSNWMQSLDMVKQQGILPTFFPVDMKLSMISPADVGVFAAEVIASPEDVFKIYEVEGPQTYSSADVAAVFAAVLGKPVKAVQTPREQWEPALQQLGFSEDGIKNFVEMTEAVIAGKAGPEGNSNAQVTTKTTLHDYVRGVLQTA